MIPLFSEPRRPLLELFDEAVAAKHYATSIDPDADFKRAAAFEPAEVQQNAQQSASVRHGPALTGAVAEPARRGQERGLVRSTRSDASRCEKRGWAIQAQNNAQNHREKPQIPTIGAAKSAADSPGAPPVGSADEDLIRLADNWSKLPKAIRKAMLALLDAAVTNGGDGDSDAD